MARVLLDGFEKHFAKIYGAGRDAKGLFENQRWEELRALQVARLDWYDQRVRECVERLRAEVPAELLSEAHWGEVKLAYIALLLDHRQPELAEVFFNTVTTRVLSRRYFQNQFMFVRPSISTEYLDLDEPSYRCYYPAHHGLRTTLAALVRDFGLSPKFEDLERDVRFAVRALRKALPRPLHAEPNFQLQVLESLLFRGREAFIVGRAVNGLTIQPWVVPIVFGPQGQLKLDALIVDPALLATLFSSTRAYFLADIDVPSTWVRFLKQMLPSKPAWELYAMVGFGKASKALFYRDLLHHLRHSTDLLTLAPGTAGLVMVVFTLPSFPFVFKVIRDRPRPPKDTDRKTVEERYLQVKRADRAGRMADTLEYADVAFPRARLSPALLDELRREVPGQLVEDGDTVVLEHLYLERRLEPLDLYLRKATAEQVDLAVDDFARCLTELAITNLFAGDLLFKNFGVTRLGRVVFYDYDEIDLVTRMRFRALPTSPFEEDELRGEAWYSVGPHDVFPEEWPPFLSPDPRVLSALKRHGHLFTPGFWNGLKEQLLSGHPGRVAPYPEAVRFSAARSPP
ncbi:MAG: bifunctional isocitrate dehydrogenase kinase/phosphatase [Myxococcaceae bacterium]|nr:bifunctional isocitrate dehydrogenase kinase/phosphatase [Myxococcaceae bacterium]